MAHFGVVLRPSGVISGCFGMNFAVMPWLKQPRRIAAATVLMSGLSAGAVMFIESHAWL